MNVLIVDKENQIAEALKEMILLTEGYENVEITHTFESALGLLKTAHFDLIITELSKIEREGEDYLLAFRKLNKSTPFFVFSTFFTKEEKDQLLSDEQTKIFVKPDFKFMMKAVEELPSSLNH